MALADYVSWNMQHISFIKSGGFIVDMNFSELTEVV